MEIIQIIMIVFALFAYSRSVLRSRSKEITSSEFAFWSVIWIAIIIVALIPGITGWLSAPLGIGRGVDIIVYLGIVGLFYLVFRLYVKMEKYRQEITKLVREMAKQNPHHPKKNNR
jgi:hypothetical protein